MNIKRLVSKYFKNFYYEKTEIREIELDYIYELYEKTKNILPKTHKKALTFSDFIDMFLEVKRGNDGKYIKYKIR